MSDRDETVHYDSPAGGWGSLRGIARIFGEEPEWRDARSTRGDARGEPRGQCVESFPVAQATTHEHQLRERGVEPRVALERARMARRGLREPARFLGHHETGAAVWCHVKMFRTPYTPELRTS